MLDEFKKLFNEATGLNNIATVLNGVHQLITYLEDNLVNETLRNAAIDAVIKLLESQKK